MSNLKIFENPEFGSIRVIEKDGEPWFVLNDICEVLGVTRQALTQRLSDDVSSTYPIQDSLGRKQ